MAAGRVILERGEILQGRPATRWAGVLAVFYAEGTKPDHIQVYRPSWRGRQAIETVPLAAFVRLRVKVRFAYVEGLLDLRDELESDFEDAGPEDETDITVVNQNHD